jgi:hypothetical protein
MPGVAKVDDRAVITVNWIYDGILEEMIWTLYLL